ncbi:glycoside hydrolase domain-containing protein [Virgibacillus sp. SK37]|uniref:glycoside hydrolase domain-containing protein n=1 Tax=Virgibacillus sp. SK37 TaxID=403957 RepID=UPI0004D11D77|nr:glycoside hydrolase domain-containing protein [Virgibacillus sp. SK37]AIF42575.1 hypothetical protein X953_04325 [Virgibacillus sp. SK37]
MKKFDLLVFLGSLTVLAVSALFILNAGKQNDDTANDDEQTSGNEGNEIFWGVDSASKVDENMYQCVAENFGEPSVWGRYLGDIEGVSVGIDKAEAELLHQKDVDILAIYNAVTDATGQEAGIDHANRAIEIAKNLEIPDDVVLIVDIEPSFPVDTAFLEGWYDTITNSPYSPGVYGVFDEESDLLTAYKATEKKVQENMIVWTAFPQVGITTKENAPEYNPQGPENSMLYGWQYGIEADACAIDTNLFKEEIFDYLW